MLLFMVMNTDHHDFIEDAIEKGALIAIISEKKINVKVPVVIVKNTNKYLIKLLNKYYDYPIEKF